MGTQLDLLLSDELYFVLPFYFMEQCTDAFFSFRSSKLVLNIANIDTKQCSFEEMSVRVVLAEH